MIKQILIRIKNSGVLKFAIKCLKILLCITLFISIIMGLFSNLTIAVINSHDMITQIPSDISTLQNAIKFVEITNIVKSWYIILTQLLVLLVLLSIDSKLKWLSIIINVGVAFVVVIMLFINKRSTEKLIEIKSAHYNLIPSNVKLALHDLIFYSDLWDMGLSLVLIGIVVGIMVVNFTTQPAV